MRVPKFKLGPIESQREKRINNEEGRKQNK
jgi:hypothetical protein